MKSKLIHVVLLCLVIALGYVASRALFAPQTQRPFVRLDDGQTQQLQVDESVSPAVAERLAIAPSSATPGGEDANLEAPRRAAQPTSLGEQLGTDRAIEHGSSRARRIVPSTLAQRRDFADLVMPQVEANLVPTCEEIVARAREQIMAAIDPDARQAGELALAELADSEVGYRLELNDALRKEILEADLSVAAQPSRDRGGVLGRISTAVGKSEVWGDGGVAEARYFLEFAKYERLAASSKKLASARERVRGLAGEASSGR
jgi:hypothetical protein